MNGKGVDADQHAVSRFWHNYLSILDKSSATKDAKPGYRKHAEAYIWANSDVWLAQHAPQHVDNFLDAKGRLPSLTEWVFRQIADAIRLLLCELIRPDWADGYDWYR